MGTAADFNTKQRAKRLLRCRHFKALATFDTGSIVKNPACEVGVAYVSVRVEGRLPCFSEGGACPKFDPFTEAEIDAEEARYAESMNRVVKARAAIVASKLKAGPIDCPCCKTPGALAFSVSDYNGHIHAKCVNGCVAWLE